MPSFTMSEGQRKSADQWRLPALPPSDGHWILWILCVEKSLVLRSGAEVWPPLLEGIDGEAGGDRAKHLLCHLLAHLVTCLPPFLVHVASTAQACLEAQCPLCESLRGRSEVAAVCLAEHRCPASAELKGNGKDA